VIDWRRQAEFDCAAICRPPEIKCFMVPENRPGICPAEPISGPRPATLGRDCLPRGSPESELPVPVPPVPHPPKVNMEQNAMKKIVLTSLFALGLSGAAMAQAATDFVSVDTDANGGVSLVEAQVAWPDLTEEAFTAADTDASGELSAEEYDALVAASAAPAAQ
jgi:hypothetical protein